MVILFSLSIIVVYTLVHATTTAFSSTVAHDLILIIEREFIIVRKFLTRQDHSFG